MKNIWCMASVDILYLLLKKIFVSLWFGYWMWFFLQLYSFNGLVWMHTPLHLPYHRSVVLQFSSNCCDFKNRNVPPQNQKDAMHKKHQCLRMCGTFGINCIWYMTTTMSRWHLEHAGTWNKRLQTFVFKSNAHKLEVFLFVTLNLNELTSLTQLRTKPKQCSYCYTYSFYCYLLLFLCWQSYQPFREQ